MQKQQWDALVAGTWHLFDKKQHSDPEYNWEEAVTESANGLTEGSKEVYIVLDASGEEVEPPSKIWWEKKGFGKGRGKGDAAGDYGGRRRSRSRSRRRQDVCSSGDLHLAIRLFARPSEVLINKIELDHMIDCIDRTVSTAEHCYAFAKQAMHVFETSAKALKEAKHTFERSLISKMHHQL